MYAWTFIETVGVLSPLTGQRGPYTHGLLRSEVGKHRSLLIENLLLAEEQSVLMHLNPADLVKDSHEVMTNHDGLL